MKIDLFTLKQLYMEATTNSQNENPSASFGSNSNEKSELMQIFEYQVKDTEWAYKDLLKEILASDNQA